MLFNACAIKDPALWHRSMKYWANDTFISTLSTSGRGKQSLSDLPLTQFLHLTTTITTFLSKPSIPIPPAHPHLSFLWPYICQNPWHLIPNLILPLTALINFLLLSFLHSLSLTLGYHFPLSALCVKASSSALLLAYMSAMCLHRRNLRTTQGPVAGNIFLFFLAFLCHSLSSAHSGHMPACLSLQQAPSIRSILKKPFSLNTNSHVLNP